MEDTELDKKAKKGEFQRKNVSYTRKRYSLSSKDGGEEGGDEIFTKRASGEG